MLNQIPVQVAHARNRIMREAVAAKNTAFRQSFIGRTLPAITLGGANSAGTDALTDNYLKVHLESENQPNRWIEVKLTALAPQGLVGEVMRPDRSFRDAESGSVSIPA